MQEKMTITLAGEAISKDLRDIAFASNKISKILNRIGYAIAAKEKLDRQTFKIETTQIKEGSLILDIVIFIASLYPDMLQYSPKEIFIKTIEFVKLLSGIYDQIPHSSPDTNHIENSGEAMILIAGSNNNVSIQVNNNTFVSIEEPVFRTAMASEKEINAINKKIEAQELEALEVDGKPHMDKSTSQKIDKGIEVIRYLKNKPLQQEHKAEIEVYEYNKKNATGKAHLKNTDLFGIKKKNSIDFYLTDLSQEPLIIQSLQTGKTLLVRYKPIIFDMVEFKELKKIEITSIDELLNY